MQLIEETIQKIGEPDQAAMRRASARWNAIAHPLHSLGKFEDVVVQIAGIQCTPEISLSKKGLIVLCADNGVVAEGISQTGQEMTAKVAENFTRGKTAAAILCEKAGADIFPIDIGMTEDTCVRNLKISRGTRDIAKGPAMTRDEAVLAIETGIRLAEEKKDAGYRILATGEMGIGNTTTASAMASVFLGEPPERMTGRGAGLDTEGLARKIRVIRQAIRVNHPDPEDPVGVLASVGGFDLAGMAGVFLGGAAAHIPVVIDGFISAVAALLAMRICPAASGYMIASHASKEPAASLVLEALGKKPFLQADMCLGEGTGAVMLFPLLDMALAVYHDMPTFEENAMEAYRELQ